MLEKIKEIGAKVAEFFQAIIVIILSFMFLGFVASIALGFITLCLGAL